MTNPFSPSTPIQLPQGLKVSKVFDSPKPGALNPSVSMALRMARVKTGEKIFSPGDPIEGIYMVKAGVVKVTSKFPSPKGRLCQENFLVDLLGEGDFFGLQDFFYGQNEHQQEAVAVRPSEVYLYPMEMIQKSLEQGGPLTEHMLRSLLQIQMRKEQRTKFQYLASVGERIIQVLVELCEKFGEHSHQGVWLKLQLTRGELAQIAGTINESLSRHLGDLKAQGLIEVYGKEILVKDIETLKKRANPILSQAFEG